MPFPDAFMKEVEVAFSQLDFCMAFNKLVPRVLPKELDLLDEYCVDELDKLLSLMMVKNLVFIMLMNHMKMLI